MPSFIFSSWMVVSFFGIILCMAIAMFVADETEDSSRRKLSVFGLAFGIAFVVGSLLHSAVAWTLGANVSVLSGTDNRDYVTHTELARAGFGFEPDKPHPLVLGSQVTTFDGSAHAGFFSAGVDFNGGPAYTVSYTHEGMTDTITLPRDATRVRIDNESAPTVLVRFKGDNAWHGGTAAYYPSHWSDCKLVISNLALACQRTEIFDPELRVGDTERHAGLGTLVSERFESAELTMTDEMYRQLIGAIK